MSGVAFTALALLGGCLIGAGFVALWAILDIVKGR